MRISELSERTGLSVDTIRYYEKIKLIPVRKNGYYKTYDEEILHLLLIIKRLRFLGLSPPQIDYLLKIDGESKRDLTEQTADTVRAMLDGLLRTIDERERQLVESKRMLLRMRNKLSEDGHEAE